MTFKRVESRVRIIKAWVNSKRFRVNIVGGEAADFSVAEVSDWHLSVPNKSDCKYIFTRGDSSKFMEREASNFEGAFFYAGYNREHSCSAIESWNPTGKSLGRVIEMLNSEYLVTYEKENYYRENKSHRVSDSVKYQELKKVSV